MMDLDPEGGVGQEGGEWGGRREPRRGRRRGGDAARSIISFSSEKETKEPWPPPLLCLQEVMLDLNPCQLVQTTKHKDDNNK